MRVAATVGVVAAGCVAAAAAEDSAHEDVLRRFLAKGKPVKCRGGASDVEEVLETPKTLAELMRLDAVSMDARLEEVEAEAAFWDETDAEGIALEPEAVLPSGWCSWRCEEEESVYLKSFEEVEALRKKYEAEFETDEYDAIAAKVLEGTASNSEIAKHEKRVEAARALIPAAKGANRLRSYIENFCVAQAGEDCSTLKVLAKDSATDLKNVRSRLVDNEQSLTRSLESEIVSSRAGGSVSEQWCDWFCLEWEKKFDDTHQQVLDRMTRTLSAVDSGRVLSKKKTNRKVAAALNYYEDLRDQIADFCA